MPSDKQPLPLHPIRRCGVCVWESRDAPPKLRYLSRLVPIDQFPIFFHGESYEEAYSKAQAFIETTIRENEENFQKRFEALEKAREAKKRKKENVI